jgi:Terminase large subunit, T4likevirus-type, N-terminal
MHQVQVQSTVEREFSPTKKQSDFLSIPWSVKEGLYGGAAGAGKTEVVVWMPLIYQFHEHPLYKGIILRRNLKQLETELISRSKEIYPSLGGVFNETKKKWTFPSGAVQYFGGADKEDDIRKFDSDQYNLISYDEATHFTEFQYSYLVMSRLRSRCADLPAIARSGTNPGNVGHSYFKNRFVKPDKNGYKLLIDGKTGLKRIFIPARIQDNPTLLENNPEYIQQLMSLSEAEKKAKLYGDWDTYEGQVFKEFRLEPLSDEPNIARHVIEPFAIPSWWPRFIGIDWGYAAYTVIYWAALAPTGRLFIYREYAYKEKKIVDYLTDLINLTEMEEREALNKVLICHSADQNRGEPSTIYEQLTKALRHANFKCQINLGEKNRLNGKLNLHEFLRWTKKENPAKIYGGEFDKEYADKIFRLYGQVAYVDYVKMFEAEKEETNIPKLQIFNTCPLLIETIPACVYQDTPEDGKKKEDVKEFDGDDPYDCIRILLSGIKDYQVANAKEFEHAHKADEAIQQLSNGDQTAFYRKMEFLESKKNAGNNSYTFRRRGFRTRH